VKDRLVTLGLALAALVAFYALLVPKTAPSAERATRPLSIEGGPNGYLALTHWLDAEGIPTVSLRHRYDRLAEVLQGRPPTGHLLISTMPHIYQVRLSEGDELRRWIAAGNTLLLVAGLSDTPDWSMGEGFDPELNEHLRSLTGLELVETEATEDLGDEEAPARDRPPAGEVGRGDEREQTLLERLEANRKLQTPEISELQPIGSHPLLARVTRLEAVSEYPAARWRVRSDVIDLVLTLAEDRVARKPALWLARYGEGQIVVSAYGSLFTNKQIGKVDNARFVANLVEWSVRPGGQVIVDDAHQGLVAFYDPQAFYSDRRLHQPLWWLLGLWLVFVLGSQRLRPTSASWQPIDLTSFVRATGGFLARVLRPAAAAQRLFDNFFADIARHTGLAAEGGAVWEWLGTHTSVAAHDLAELRDLHARAAQGGRVDPVKVQTLLAQLRERLK
jgi:Domain of unknown function (DUF4350)